MYTIFTIQVHMQKNITSMYNFSKNSPYSLLFCIYAEKMPKKLQSRKHTPPLGDALFKNCSFPKSLKYFINHASILQLEQICYQLRTFSIFRAYRQHPCKTFVPSTESLSPYLQCRLQILLPQPQYDIVHWLRYVLLPAPSHEYRLYSYKYQ